MRRFAAGDHLGGARRPYPSSAASSSAQVITFVTAASAATVVACTSRENAAHPSDKSTAPKSRTCASRSVEATPPFVTMPAKINVSSPAFRSTHSSRLM